MGSDESNQLEEEEEEEQVVLGRGLVVVLARAERVETQALSSFLLQRRVSPLPSACCGFGRVLSGCGLVGGCVGGGA